MTYGEKCNKEIKNDEWKDHILSIIQNARVKKVIVKFVR